MLGKPSGFLSKNLSKYLLRLHAPLLTNVFQIFQNPHIISFKMLAPAFYPKPKNRAKKFKSLL